jgi:hypothetical protein
VRRGDALVTQQDPNHPESLGPIRSFLIDFGCSKGLRTVICAKLFIVPMC